MASTLIDAGRRISDSRHSYTLLTVYENNFGDLFLHSWDRYQIMYDFCRIHIIGQKLCLPSASHLVSKRHELGATVSQIHWKDP